jgi:hypothetical protein
MVVVWFMVVLDSVNGAALARRSGKQSECMGEGARIGANGGHDTGPGGRRGGRVCAALKLADDGLSEC